MKRFVRFLVSKSRLLMLVASTLLLPAAHAQVQAPACAGVAPCVVTNTSVEYRHKTTGVYFNTACSNEQQLLDGLPAAFERSGRSFAVNLATSASTDATVARYLFGPPATNAALPTRHFYTAIATEKTQLNVNLAALNNPALGCIEGNNLGFVAAPLGLQIDNSVTPPALISPVGDVKCAAGTTPIWRAYNTAVPQHRFTTDYVFLTSNILPDVTAANPSAWTNEGVKMCAPAPRAVYSLSINGAAPSLAASGSTTVAITTTNTTPNTDNATVVPVLRLALPANVTASVAGYTCATEAGTEATGLQLACNLGPLSTTTPSTVSLSLNANASYVSGNSVLKATLSPTGTPRGEALPSACVNNGVAYFGCLVQTIAAPSAPGETGAAPNVSDLSFTVNSATSSPTNSASITARYLVQPALIANLYLYAQYRDVGVTAWTSAGSPTPNPFQGQGPNQYQTVPLTINAGSNGGSKEVRFCLTTSAFFDSRAACGNDAVAVTSAAQVVSFGQSSSSSIQIIGNTLSSNLTAGSVLPAFTFNVRNTGTTTVTGLTCSARISNTIACSPDATTFGSGAETICRCGSLGIVNASGNVTLSASADGGLSATSNAAFFVQSPPPSGSVTQTTVGAPVGSNAQASTSGNSVTLTFSVNNPTGNTISGVTLKVFYAAAANTPNNQATQGEYTPSSALSLPAGSSSQSVTVTNISAQLTAAYFKVCLLGSGTTTWLACGDTSVSKESPWSTEINFGPPPPPPAAVNLTFKSNPASLSVGETAAYQLNAVSADAGNLVNGALTLSVRLPANYSFVSAGSSSTCQPATTDSLVVQCSVQTSGALPATGGVDIDVVVRPLPGAGGVAAQLVGIVASAPTTSVTCAANATGCNRSTSLAPSYYDLTVPTATISLPGSSAPTQVTCGKAAAGTDPVPATASCVLQVTYTDNSIEPLSTPELYTNGTATLRLCAAGTTNPNCNTTLNGAKSVKTVAVSAASNSSPNYENNTNNNSATIYTLGPQCTDQVSAANKILDGNSDFNTPAIDATMSGNTPYVIELIPGQNMATLGRNLNKLTWDIRSGYSPRDVAISPCKGDFTSSAAQVVVLGNDGFSGASGNVFWAQDEPNRTTGAGLSTPKHITSDRRWYINFRNTQCAGSSFGANTCIMYWFAIPAF